MAKQFIQQFGGAGGMVGMGSINRALASGMTVEQIRKALKSQGIGTGQKATEFLAARGKTLTPSGLGPSAFTQQFDQGNLAAHLRTYGTQGGAIGIQGYKDLASLGHSPYQLQEAVQNAAKYGLKIGTNLQDYFRTGIDPRETAAFEEERNATIRDATAQTLADSEATRQQMEDQFRRQQKAAEERAKAESEAARMQMLRERGAGRAANLQIQGQPGFRGRGGSAGFRRRSDQFRINPYKGVGLGGSSVGATNSMVNI